MDPFNIRNAPRKSGREATLVSTYLPSSVAEQISLNALVHGQARSLWLVKAATLLLKQQKISQQQAMQILAQRVRSKWEYLKTSQEHEPEWDESKELRSYLDEVRRILRRRGVTEETSEQIIKQSGLI